VPSFYEEAISDVRELLAEFGTTTDLLLYSSEPADSDFPEDGPAAPTVADTASVLAVFVPLSSTSELGISKMIDGDLLKRCSEVLITEVAEGKDLTSYTKIRDEGVLYGIEWAYALRPANVTVLYAFGVKR
jgi:hypothetical protein